jgi:uncharacterized glyoxalase superfamily protein PhnB
MVYEIRPDGADKGKALVAFMGESAFRGRRPVAVGDDLTDETMFRAAIDAGGLAFRVGTRGRSWAESARANDATEKRVRLPAPRWPKRAVPGRAGLVGPRAAGLCSCADEGRHFVNIYLTFGGNCRAAMEFYRSFFGGEFQTFRTFGEAPYDMPVDASTRDLVMHSSLEVDGSMLMASDQGAGDPLQIGNNFSIALAPQSRGRCDELFARLAAR